MWQDFKAFLIKQNALALAIGVVIGGALDGVVKGLVGGLIMPIVSFATPKDQSWQTWKTPGPIAFEVGTIANALLQFFIIGFVAWRLSRAFIQPEPAKAATKACPHCFMGDVDLKATRCPHCTQPIEPGTSVTPEAAAKVPTPSLLGGPI